MDRFLVTRKGTVAIPLSRFKCIEPSWFGEYKLRYQEETPGWLYGSSLQDTYIEISAAEAEEIGEQLKGFSKG